MRQLRWPHASLLIALVLALGWVVSTWFFTLEAWGARGETKSVAFDLWALMTWCGLPLAVIAAATIGVIGLVDAR